MFSCRCVITSCDASPKKQFTMGHRGMNIGFWVVTNNGDTLIALLVAMPQSGSLFYISVGEICLSKLLLSISHQCVL